MNSLPELPPDAIPLQHQVAGHVYGKSKTKFGLLQRCSTGEVLKPLLDERRGPREQHFYTDAFSDQASEVVRGLRPFMATPLGTYEYDLMKYLILENVLQPFIYPCVADVKIGRITYDREASAEKRESCNGKFPSVIDFGFQLLGWQVYRPADNLYEYHDKICGRSLKKEEILHAIAHFYGAPEAGYREVVRSLLGRLTILERVMSKQYEYTFIASSLLIVYEGKGVEKNSPHHEKKVDVRIVDFAHVFKQEEGVGACRSDENFLFGLRNYMDHLRRLLDDAYVYVSNEKWKRNTSRDGADVGIDEQRKHAATRTHTHNLY